MTTLDETRLSIAEVAFLSGMSAKEINREIDAKVITTSGAERCLRGPDVVYLFAIKDWKAGVGPSVRRTLRKVINAAVSAHQPTARFYSLTVPVAELEHSVLDQFAQLEQQISEHIEERDDVMGGEAVVRGTRVPARHLADLRRRGSSIQELQDDFEVTEEQIRAALVYAQTRPQRGRPSNRRARNVHVSPAR